MGVGVGVFVAGTGVFVAVVTGGVVGVGVRVGVFVGGTGVGVLVGGCEPHWVMLMESMRQPCHPVW